MHLKAVMDTWPTPSAFPLLFVFAPALKTSPGAVANLPIELPCRSGGFQVPVTLGRNRGHHRDFGWGHALLALQIRAVADTANLLTEESSEVLVAAGFCVLITLFAILFGTSRRPVAPATKVWSWLLPSNLWPNFWLT